MLSVNWYEAWLQAYVEGPWLIADSFSTGGVLHAGCAITRSPESDTCNIEQIAGLPLVVVRRMQYQR